MKNKNIYDKIFEKKCAVCGHRYMADIYDQGECSNCGWYNGKIYSEFPDNVIFSNLVPLNKAIKLYKENKPMKPDLDDFLEAFEHYGETGFDYKNVGFSLFRNGENGIQFNWGPNPYGTIYFKDKEDFIQNAKIGNEYVRDIWDKVENPCYL